MANISNYDAKVYFWGMVLFATVSFIALPITAFIYFDNRVLKSEIAEDRRKNERLRQKLEDELKGIKDAANSRGNRVEPD